MLRTQDLNGIQPYIHFQDSIIFQKKKEICTKKFYLLQKILYPWYVVHVPYMYRELPGSEEIMFFYFYLVLFIKIKKLLVVSSSSFSN